MNKAAERYFYKMSCYERTEENGQDSVIRQLMFIKMAMDDNKKKRDLYYMVFKKNYIVHG
jgi:hypothetical protein